MFKPVSTKVHFPSLEEEILNFWKSHDIFQKSLKVRENSPTFILYEGPPTANGRPGIHHVLSRVFKDIFPRYKTMKGYYCPRKAGWDCHGLPVELEIEKELGFSTKSEIESYGIEKFNARCRESVFRYLKDWEALTERIAFWLDMDNPYITMDNSYIESVWWILKQLWDRGLIYLSHKITPYCPRCQTSLSSHEVALGYKENTVDPSIYVKFKLSGSWKGHKPVYLLAWTTTPWTLPANTALAVLPDAEYALVRVKDEKFILAKQRLEAAGLKEAEVINSFYGRELAGYSFEPLFDPLKFNATSIPDADAPPGKIWQLQSNSSLKLQTVGEFKGRIIEADFVSLEEGTGIVHIAPAFGEEDYEEGKKHGLFFLQPVDLQGRFTGSYPFSGKFVKDADRNIIEDLSLRGLLYRGETIVHTYPFCWRCDSPLLYYAKKSWFIRTTAVKEKLIEGNEKINWYPGHIKHGRFGEWLQSNVDWALSRERYWGTPLPIWVHEMGKEYAHCPNFGKYECIGSLEELSSKPGLEGWKEGMDLHRPYIDRVSYRCPSCGGRMVRLPEVIDCWFDSGAMPFAQWHYPFENKELFQHFFPADYICEGIDQTRGWFYTLHAISTLLLGEPCYQNVISLGHVLDAKGEKMAKSKGNVVEPWEIINRYGADPLRWYMFTASPPGEARRFDPKQISQLIQSFFLTLWNSYVFFVTYANIDGFDPTKFERPKVSDLDRWLISKLNLLIAEVTKDLDNYDPTSAGRKIEAFVDQLSNWYIRRSRRRFWKSENDQDKLSAYFTLYETLVTLSKLLAPFIPFLSEEIYRNLVCSIYPQAPESIHLTNFPVANSQLIDKDLLEDMDVVIRLCHLARSIRSKAGIKVRQPLSQALIRVKSEREKEGVERLKEQFLEEVNIKSLRFNGEVPFGWVVAEEGGYAVAIDISLTAELICEGLAREIVHWIQNMRKSAGFDITDRIILYYQADGLLKRSIEDFSQYICQETLALELVPGLPEGVYSQKLSFKEGEVVLGIRKVIL